MKEEYTLNKANGKPVEINFMNFMLSQIKKLEGLGCTIKKIMFTDQSCVACQGVACIPVSANESKILKYLQRITR